MSTVYHISPTNLQTTFKREKSKDNKQDGDRGSVEKSISEPEIASVVPNALTTSSYISQLKIWNGSFSDEPLWRIFLKPFPFILSPVVSERTLQWIDSRLMHSLQTWFLFLAYSMQTVWLSKSCYAMCGQCFDDSRQVSYRCVLRPSSHWSTSLTLPRLYAISISSDSL